MVKWWVLAVIHPRDVEWSTNRSSLLSDNWFLIGATMGIILLWVGLYYWDKIRNRFLGRGDDTKSLFDELCHCHQLSRPEQTQLLRAVEIKQLELPALIFVDPQLLSNLAASTDPEAAQYRSLAQRLFGDAAAS